MTIDARLVRTVLAGELSTGGDLHGGAGIRRDNLSTFLVDPYLVQADRSEGKGVPSDLWVVLEEQPCVADSSLVAWDPAAEDWVVLERDRDGRYRITERAASFAEAVAAL